MNAPTVPFILLLFAIAALVWALVRDLRAFDAAGRPSPRNPDPELEAWRRRNSYPVIAVALVTIVVLFIAWVVVGIMSVVS